MVAAIALLLCGSGANAANPPLNADNLFRPLLLSDGSYDEGWEQVIRFADGTLLTAHFMITNLGPGSHRGNVIATLTTADGRLLLVKNGRSQHDWEPLSGAQRIGIANHRLEKTGGGYRLYLHNSVAEIELTFTPETSPWPVPTLSFADDRYQELYYFAPRLTANGRYRAGLASGAGANEPWRELKDGRGYALRYVNSTGSHEFSRERLRFTGTTGGPVQVTGDMLTGTDGAGHSRLVVDFRQRRLPAASAVTLAPQHRGSGGIPEAVNVTAQGPGYRLEGELRLDRRLQEFTVLDHLGGLERFLIGAYSRPVQYRYLAHYRYTLTVDGATETATGSALLEYVAINPRESVSLAIPGISKDSNDRTSS